MPVFGNWSVTRSCLLSLQRQSIPHGVILVDDASTDDTVVRVRAEFPAVEVIEMSENSGFAKACNRGFAVATGAVVVLVNNDVLADEMMLEYLARAIENDASAGSAVPLLLAPDGTVDSYGITADVTLAGFVRFHGADADVVSSTTPTLLGPYGAVAAFRREALIEVGTFDESIIMYGEELELSLRLREAGWNSVAVPESKGVHVGGSTAGGDSARKRYLAGIGRGYTLNVYGVLVSKYFFRAFFTEFLICFRRLLVSHDTASFRGRIAGWRSGRGSTRKPRPSEGIDISISLRDSLSMRSASYWKSDR